MYIVHSFSFFWFEAIYTSHCSRKVDDTCIVFDGMYVVNKMEPKTFAVKSGADLTKVFMDHVDDLSVDATKIRIVFDTYRSVSLKNKTRKRRKKWTILCRLSGCSKYEFKQNKSEKVIAKRRVERIFSMQTFQRKW